MIIFIEYTEPIDNKTVTTFCSLLKGKHSICLPWESVSDVYRLIAHGGNHFGELVRGSFSEEKLKSLVLFSEPYCFAWYPFEFVFQRAERQGRIKPNLLNTLHRPVKEWSSVCLVERSSLTSAEAICYKSLRRPGGKWLFASSENSNLFIVRALPASHWSFRTSLTFLIPSWATLEKRTMYSE